MCNTSRNGTEDGPFLFTHGSDTAFCIELVDQCIHEMRDEGLSRYKLLLQAVRAKVYGPNMVHPPSAAGLGMDTSGVHVTMLNPSEGGTLDLSQPWISGQDQGLQNYVDEIIGFFNEDMNDVDDGLREWYSSIVNEVQPQGAA